MQAVRIRVLGWLERHGVIDARAELGIVDDEFAEREPALAPRSACCCSTTTPGSP